MITLKSIIAESKVKSVLPVNEAMVSPKNGHQFFQLTKDTPIKFIKSQSGMNAPGVFLHNKDGFIKGKKDAYLIDYFGAAFYVDLKNKFASKIYPMKDQTDLRYNSNFKETDKAPEMSDWKKFLKESVNEGKDETYFKSFTDAVSYARAAAEKRGFEINEDDWQTQIALGGRYSRGRPSIGKTNSFSVGLLKAGKPQRKNLNISVYGMESGKFELTYYIN